jgi:hypothetical protein
MPVISPVTSPDEILKGVLKMIKRPLIPGGEKNAL